MNFCRAFSGIPKERVEPTASVEPIASRTKAGLAWQAKFDLSTPGKAENSGPGDWSQVSAKICCPLSARQFGQKQFSDLLTAKHDQVSETL